MEALRGVGDGWRGTGGFDEELGAYGIRDAAVVLLVESKISDTEAGPFATRFSGLSTVSKDIVVARVFG